MSGIDVVESRISALQNAISALANGTPPASSSGEAFSSVLSAQSADLSTTMDQAGGALLTSDDSATSLGGSLAPSLGTVLGTADAGSTLGSFLGSDSGPPTGADVVADAKRYLGVPYRWGGTNPASGLDCSGLVQRVMKDLGVSVPRTVRDQRNVGQEVDSLAQAKPGDLLVFGSHHIGIYVGNGKMLHAPHTGDKVKISDVYETPTRIRRILPSGSTAATSAVDSLRPISLRQSNSGDASHRYDALFERATRTYDLPAGLLRAVASVESSFNPRAVSPAGARGLMQLMPGTARGLGVNPMDPAQAVDGAARMLSGLVHQFGSVKLALAAYNAGAGAVKKYDGVPPYAETQTYVKRVLSRMEELMSQNTVSIDASSVAGAATPQPARSVDPDRQSEFAAHLRQAGRDTAPDRTARADRRGASPDRTGDDADGTTPDGDGSTTNSTGTASGSAGSAGSTGSPGSATDSQPVTPTTSADATAGAQLAGAVVAAASTAPTAAATAQITATAGAVTGAVAHTPTGGVAPAVTAKGATVVGTSRGAADLSAVTPGASGPTGAHGLPGAAAAGTDTATSTTAPAAGAAPRSAATDPSTVLSAGSASGAVAGSVDASAVVGSTAAPPNAAPLSFSPMATPTPAVTSAGSATAASAPAPTTTAPPTSMATQLAAGLRSLPGRGDGVHVMTVRLHPDELGPVRVVARLTGTEVHLRITASSVAAAAAVSEAAPRLHEALGSSGLTTTGVSVDHDTDLGGQSSQGSQHAGQGPAGTSAEGRGGKRSSSSRETGAGAGGFGHGVHLDVNPTSSPSRHPTARSLDLHV